MEIGNYCKKHLITLVLAVAVLSGSVLCGCGATSQEDPIAVVDAQNDFDKHEVIVFDDEGNEIETETPVIEQLEQEISAEEVISNSGIDLNNLDSLYGYGRLDVQQQKVYREIYAILSEMQTDVILSTRDSDEVDLAFGVVMMDHPEIFYVTGYSLGNYSLGGIVTSISFSGTYSMPKEQVEVKKQIIEAYVDNILSGIDDTADEYDKVKYVYDYLIDNLEYDISAPNNQNILGLCESGKTVCQGYSKMLQYVLGRLGVFATIASGNARENPYAQSGPHSWNIVKVNGQYYNVDTTWGDASYYLTDANGNVGTYPERNYDYFLVPDSWMIDNHSISEIVPMPRCTADTDNYFVRSGLYFESVDKDALKRAFDTAYMSGDTSISLKCSNDYVYEQMYDYLIEDEAIFDYLGSERIRYAEYPERKVLLVYL